MQYGKLSRSFTKKAWPWIKDTRVDTTLSPKNTSYTLRWPLSYTAIQIAVSSQLSPYPLIVLCTTRCEWQLTTYCVMYCEWQLTKRTHNCLYSNIMCLRECAHLCLFLAIFFCLTLSVVTVPVSVFLPVSLSVSPSSVSLCVLNMRKTRNYNSFAGDPDTESVQGWRNYFQFWYLNAYKKMMQYLTDTYEGQSTPPPTWFI